MNKELLLRVADVVEAGEVRGEPVELNMYAWHSNQEWSCGTTACIGGYVDLVLDHEHKVTEANYWDDKQKNNSVFSLAREALDLSTRDAINLMTDSDVWGLIHRNRPLVPDALRWMALTGKIDWVDAIRAAKCVRDNKENVQ